MALTAAVETFQSSVCSSLEEKSTPLALNSRYALSPMSRFSSNTFSAAEGTPPKVTVGVPEAACASARSTSSALIFFRCPASDAIPSSSSSCFSASWACQVASSAAQSLSFFSACAAARAMAASMSFNLPSTDPMDPSLSASLACRSDSLAPSLAAHFASSSASCFFRAASLASFSASLAFQKASSSASFCSKATLLASRSVSLASRREVFSSFSASRAFQLASSAAQSATFFSMSDSILGSCEFSSSSDFIFDIAPASSASTSEMPSTAAALSCLISFSAVFSLAITDSSVACASCTLAISSLICASLCFMSASSLRAAVSPFSPDNVSSFFSLPISASSPLVCSAVLSVRFASSILRPPRLLLAASRSAASWLWASLAEAMPASAASSLLLAAESSASTAVSLSRSSPLPPFSAVSDDCTFCSSAHTFFASAFLASSSSCTFSSFCSSASARSVWAFCSLMALWRDAISASSASMAACF
mmetsp:Transcript_32848/g.71646  ORF Transcript_32848/g.71646 Transcript_32848/m.71646 type:complete len:481 (-) Transcript_32848:815-2257(-)